MIELDYVIYWNILDTIEKLDVKEESKLKLKEIFKPNNQELFEEYNEIINKSIEEYKLKEEERLKKLELEEQRKKQKEEEIKRRMELVNLLIRPMDKLGCYDSKILHLKDEISLSINNYINLQTEKIVLSEELEKKLKHFVNTIRIEIETRNQILLII